MAFLDEVKKSLASTGKQVAKKTKELTDTVQLKSQIASEKETVTKAYAAIGKQLFESASEEEKERFEAEFDSIRKSMEKIRELEEKLSEVDGSIFCPECGARITKTSIFCSHCGKKVEKCQTEVTAIPDALFEEEETATVSEEE